MRKQNKIYSFGIKSERFIIQPSHFFWTLVHTTVHEKSCSPCFDHIARTSNDFCGSTKREFHTMWWKNKAAYFFLEIIPSKLITNTIVYMIKPYKQTGTPKRLEHPPTGQDWAMISPYERYPEKSIPAIAMIKMTLSAIIFFIVRKK